MKKVWSMLMLLAIYLVACTNIDSLEDDVDALKKRVTIPETQARDINSNTEALHELYDEGTFITNIEEKSDSYTLTSSNGKTVNPYMKNGSSLLYPIIGIDSKGYWTVLYNKNEAPERLTVNGQPVKASGESGKTFTFNIDSEGYWQVSYDGGKNYSYIYKEGTNDKVSVTGDGLALTENKNFKSVTVENNELVLVLAGEGAPTIRIPIARNSECSLAAEDLEQVQELSAGEVKEFTMIVRGVENIMITVLGGRSAKFSKKAGKENVLVVTAPTSSAKMMTHATAGNSTDVAVLATSREYAMIAKIRVKVIDIPQSKDFYTECNTSENTTIGNVFITRGANEVILLDGSNESASSIRNPIYQKIEQTVIFSEKGAYDFNTLSIAEIAGTAAIIGRYSDSKLILRPELLWKLKSGKLIFKNIQLDLTKIDASGGNNKYMFCNADATADFEDFVFEDYEITNIQKNLYYNNVVAYTIKSIYAKNSRSQLNTTVDGIPIFNIHKTTYLDATQMSTFENNIVHNKTFVAGQILSWGNKIVQTPNQQQIEVSFYNNSIINCVGKSYHLKFYDATKMTTSKNTFHVDPNINSDATMCGVYKIESTPELDMKDNIAYGLIEANKWDSFSTTAKPTNPIEEQLLCLTNSPFTSVDLDKGIFIPGNAYIRFGSTTNQ